MQYKANSFNREIERERGLCEKGFQNSDPFYFGLVNKKVGANAVKFVVGFGMGVGASGRQLTAIGSNQTVPYMAVSFWWGTF